MKLLFKAIFLISAFSLFQFSAISQWVNVSSGTTNFLNGINVVTVNTVYAVGFSGTVLKSSNAGVNWEIMGAPSPSNINNLSFPPVGIASTGWAASASGLYKTTNSGTNWTLQIAGVYSDVYFINENTGIAFPNNGTQPLKRTTNGGTNYTDIVFNSQPNLIARDLEAASSAYWYILAANNTADSSFIFKSANSGVNWSLVYKTTGYYNGISFVDINTGVMIGNNGTINKTTNQGANWVTVSSGVSSGLQCVNFINSTTGYITGASGTILKSTNTGDNWFLQTSNTTQTLRSVSGISNESIVIACGGNGTILRTTNGGVDAVTQIGTEVPREYTLEQNYPNPFNPETKINFSISAVNASGFQKVSIYLYDVLGRLVSKIAEHDLKPGKYSVDFNASGISSGIYYYTLSTGDFKATKKMILIK